MRKRLIIPALIAGLVMAVAVNALAYSRDVNDVSECVLRLHVIANSDNDADQAIKLKVRDAIIKYSDDMHFKAQNKEEYVSEIENRISDIERVACDTLKELGSDDTAYAELTRTYFPTRKYGDVTLPAGEYDALRVVIGEGKGKNWWCIMFPPLCSNAVAEKEAVSYLENNLNSGAFMMITEADSNVKYELRFKVVDIINEWQNK